MAANKAQGSLPEGVLEHVTPGADREGNPEMARRTDTTKTSTTDAAAAAARIRATVASESRSYTDPAANYPRARQHQEQRLSGAARRRPS